MSWMVLKIELVKESEKELDLEHGHRRKRVKESDGREKKETNFFKLFDYVAYIIWLSFMYKLKLKCWVNG